MKTERYITMIVIGLFIFLFGWAIRSTISDGEQINKPIGGVAIAVGLLMISYYAYKLFKH